MGSASAPSPERASSAGDLEQLFGAFNEVTAKLQATHERLTGEVVRLQGELRRANDELERSRRLAALGEMAAGIAHEVRNPLGSIGLYAEMLIADLSDRVEQRTTAEKILRSVQGLDAVVTDVLAFSREMRVVPERQSSVALFERSVASCRDVLAGRSVRVDGEQAFDGDGSLLLQAMVNLVRNAAEAAGPGGFVRLVASSEARSAEGSSVRLAVEDSGPGVTDEVMERMFNPFFTTRAAGTGLGLAIVHRIVDAHGGQVRVRNRPARGEDPGGATVEMVLPDRSSVGSEGRRDADPRSAA
ncbi:MAG: sensor histidine kinase [Phycisphaerales bacterium]